MRVVVVGGGIAGLSAARRLEALLPDNEVVLLERTQTLGGKIRTERSDGFVIEAAPDSFLSRKERGVGLCEELGLGGELVGRRPENARTFVRHARELHPLPEGLTGMIPTSLESLAESRLLSPRGKARLAAEVDVPPAEELEDESIASFVTRRLGPEAYESLIEPLMAGVYGGDGEQLSLQSTFPQLRALELEHGSVIRGLLAQPSEDVFSRPPFLTLRPGMDALVTRLAQSLERTRLVLGRAVRRTTRHGTGYAVELESGEAFAADALLLATPAFVSADLLVEIDDDLAAAHGEIPHASSAIVTLAYSQDDVRHPLDGYGYVVPRSDGSAVLACTWTSRKWEARAPAGSVLLRVYAGRFGGRDVTVEPDADLLALARDEVRGLGITAEPILTRVHRWPRGMPQYVLGHTQRIQRIERALEPHPCLALAGASYSGVGIPDCIRSGEEAAESLARALEGARV